MAIFPTLHTAAHHHPQSPGIEQVTDALYTITLSSPAAASTNVTSTLSIPLDEEQPRSALAGYLPRRREPLRRDSLKRREALLKGREGSRRRQRWENGLCFSRHPLC
jgi:R3H-associated N-terminal domain